MMPLGFQRRAEMFANPVDHVLNFGCGQRGANVLFRHFGDAGRQPEHRLRKATLALTPFELLGLADQRFQDFAACHEAATGGDARRFFFHKGQEPFCHTASWRLGLRREQDNSVCNSCLACKR